MTTMNTNKLKAGAVSLLLATSMIASATAVSFKDVPETHWAYPSITKLSDIGVINGVGNGLYDPDRTLTNAEFFVLMARRFYGFEVNQAEQDMYVQYGGAAGTAWYDQALYELGITEILERTNIRLSEFDTEMDNPNESITRYDMAQIIYNYLGRNGDELEKLSDTSVVADWDAIPANYRDAVSTCYALGYLTGVDGAGTFAGNQGVTRAAAATIIDRMVQPNHVEIPEGAYRVKPGDPIIEEMWHVYADGDNFRLVTDGITEERPYVKIAANGKYSTIVVVATSARNHGIYVSEHEVERLSTESIVSHSSVAMVVDISGRQVIRIGSNASAADLTITDIYLY